MTWSSRGWTWIANSNFRDRNHQNFVLFLLVVVKPAAMNTPWSVLVKHKAENRSWLPISLAARITLTPLANVYCELLSATYIEKKHNKMNTLVLAAVW